MSWNASKYLLVPLIGFCCLVSFSPAALGTQKPKLPLKGVNTPSETGKRPVSLRLWKRTRSLKRLESAVLDGVTLDASQTKTVKATFAALYASMHENPMSAARIPRTRATYSEQKLENLALQVAAEEKAGNTKLAKEIKADIDKHTRGTNANFTRIPEDIIPDLAALMKGDQLVAYYRATDRWQALEPTSPFDGPVRMLIRCIKDPALKLSPVQQQEAEAILGATILAVRKNRDPQNVADLAAKARFDLQKNFNSKQRSHMDGLLKMFTKEFQAIRQYAGKWFGSRGHPVPIHHDQPIPWAKIKVKKQVKKQPAKPLKKLSKPKKKVVKD